MNQVSLRDAAPEDIAAFIALQRDPIASHMAAFTAADPDDEAQARKKWRDILEDEKIYAQAVVLSHAVVGNALSFVVEDTVEVSYWIDRRYWGHGVATTALGLLLARVTLRPLRARTAVDNVRSQAVLRRNGFAHVGDDCGFANARGGYTDEYIFELN